MSIADRRAQIFMPTRWTPGFFSRVFFKESWAVKITPSGLMINGHFYGWASIKSCHVKPTFFWSHLQLQFEAEGVSLRGMSRSLAIDITASVEALRTLWPAITALREAMASDRYVANKTLREVIAIAGDAVLVDGITTLISWLAVATILIERTGVEFVPLGKRTV